ncbi:hypothetical protein ABR738_04885 [Streptomyces sp. Edi4]|uniref:hypothetical protein n=1 Tax=Streptomyces sp. Edi4 TaxID=3162527 RepID=UPI0033056337
MLTAALLTPAQFPTVLGDDYPEACAALGLGPYAQGYGLVLGQDGSGARWTVVIDDVSLVAVAIASWDCGMEYELSPDDRTVVAALPGWPLELAVSAPGVPAPHDPEPDPSGPPTLTPPDTSEWGPAQRRLGADAVALQWPTWREQLDTDTFGAPPGSAASGSAGSRGPSAGSEPESDRGDAEAGEGGREGPRTPGSPRAAVFHDDEGGVPHDEGGAEEPGHRAGPDAITSAERRGDPEAGADGPHADEHRHGDGRRSGVGRALRELRGYLEAAPPVGRVRSAFAPGGARTLRADGPGWSLVARTDDVAFVLLDECPGHVHPVGRDEDLPPLLESLEAMAVRPS